MTYAVVIRVPCQQQVVLGDAEARLLLLALVRVRSLLGVLSLGRLAGLACRNRRNLVKLEIAIS